MSFNYDDAFPERWLHAVDLQGKEVTLTITKAYLEELRLPGGSIDSCAILAFAKTEREYVLNKTNAMVLRDLWGTSSEDWIGKPLGTPATLIWGHKPGQTRKAKLKNSLYWIAS